MPKHLLSVLLLVFLLARVDAVLAQKVIQDNYTIRGYVIVPSNNHDERFEVLLMIKDGDQILDRTNVSISNFYSFSNLSHGYYDLVVRLDGFKDTRVQVRAGIDQIFGGASDFSVSPTNSNVLIPNPLDVNLFLEPKSDVGEGTPKERSYSKELLAEYAKGMEEITNGHPDLAVSYLERVVKQVPDFFDAHFNLGMVYQDLSRRTEAEKEYRTAHELNSDSARPLLALGRLFLEEADIEIQTESKSEAIQPKLMHARDALTRAVALDPKLATGFYYLGAVDFRSASYGNAVKELKHALELDPALDAARITLINVFVEQKLWQPALDNVDTFLLEYPSSPYRQQVAATRVGIVRRIQTPQ